MTKLVTDRDTKTGQLWAYAADDRPWGGADPPGVAYVYAPDRKADRPLAHLAGFEGILQVDGYAGYGKLAERGDVQLAFCWSHMRRNFYELATPGPAPIAGEALKHIAELYAVEKDIRGRGAEERRLVRQQKIRPLAEAFERWLRAKLALISQKGKLDETAPFNRVLESYFPVAEFSADGSRPIQIEPGWFIRPIGERGISTCHLLRSTDAVVRSRPTA